MLIKKEILLLDHLLDHLLEHLMTHLLDHHLLVWKLLMEKQLT